MMFLNLAHLHWFQALRYGPRVALRYRRHGLWHDVTWQQYWEDSFACAAALAEAGIRAGERVGLLSENRVEWLIADMGILAAGAVNVPPHAPLTARQVHYQLQDAGTRWLFVSTRAQLAKVRQIRGELPEVDGIVVFDDTGDELGGVLSWQGFLQRGRRALRESWRENLFRIQQQTGPDHLATIMYTSGTTGNPKGVMLTHGNLLSNAQATHAASDTSSAEILLNWLPFSHIYARTVDHYLMLVAGATLCLADSQETLVRDLGEIQPTHLSAVPRFYEKVLAAVGDDPQLARQRLRNTFGPRMRWLGSGGAPLPPAVAHAFHQAGLVLLQGYGLTESSPVISFNRKNHYKLETVGLPLPGVEVAIAPDGEVLTRGPHVMKGYWNNPQATAETIRDGWLHTGDLGRVDEDGFLSITGRKKELLVLSNGKKVVPSFIEGLLLADPCIDQVMVHGEGRSFLTALVVPHWVNLRREMNLPPQAKEETLAEDPTVREFLARRMEAALVEVAGWEKVKKFVILPQPFSVAREELTVSLKLRRNVIFEHYHEAIERLYRE